MSREEGSGWHHEPRRHHEAAMKGHDRVRAHVVQEARGAGFERKIGKHPIKNEGSRFRQACRNTPVREMEPCLICGMPIPKQYTACPFHGRD